MSKSFLFSIDEFEEAGKYWSTRLSGKLPEIKLFRDFPETKQYGADHCKIDFENKLTERILYISKKNHLSLYIILLTAFEILLFKYLEQGDIIVVSPIYVIDNREYNNFVVLRNFIEPEMTFKELLMDVRKTVLEGYENEHYPLKGLMDSLKPDENFSLFRIILLLENIHKRELIFDHIADFENDITLSFKQNGEELGGDIIYNSKLFKKNTIQKLCASYLHILDQVLDKTGLPVSQLELMTEDEKNKILFEFNDNKSDYLVDNTIHRLFEQQVEKTPGNSAVGIPIDLSAGKNLSFQCLNEKANRLARVLREKGVRANSIVGLMLESSLEMVIGILGVLKAGGAYLSIDPAYPPDRKKYVTGDSNVKIILTQKDLYKETQVSIPAEIILVPDEENLYPGNGSNLNIENNTHDLAYVIYTSGTAGTPKGVLIEHKGIVNYTQWRIEHYNHRETDITLQLLSYAFDGFNSNFYSSLLSGGTLLMVPESKRMDFDFIINLIRESGVTNISLVPGMYGLILDNAGSEDLKRLRFVVLAGEKSGETLIKKSKEKVPGLLLINEYGPTETTVTAVVNEGMDETGTNIIGKPISGIYIYILNRSRECVPVEVPGELCIGGIGRARGYLNNSELTAGKFAVNPFLEKERLYRTGDRARWLLDGNIEFLGRIDRQVKIRGFRVELSEIETQLLKREGIRAAIVLAREGEDGNKYLCAYIVSDKEMTASELTVYLSDTLPSHMIPSYYEFLEKLPLTTNGKIDSKALPDPEGVVPDREAELVLPGNAIEEELLKIWCSVLGRENIGITDNFFTIGGDSIRSIQISARMNKAGYKVEVKDIFQNPTISKLAPLVRKVDRIASQSLVTGEIPLTPIQEWFFSRFGINAHHFNHAVMLYSKEGFDEEAIKAVFLAIREHHDILRVIFKKMNGKIIQYNQDLDNPFSLLVYDLRDREDAPDILERRANEIQVSFNLEKGPLMKLGLFHLNDGDRLLIVIHHLLVDGISWRILFEDFEILYEQYKKGEKFSLPYKTDSYKRWSEKLSEYANKETFLEEIEYWKQLELSPVPLIVKDMEEGSNYVKDVETLSFSLSEEETNHLLGGVNDAFNTEINDILLSGLGLSIGKCFGHKKIAIGLEGHGREEIIDDVDISRTFGWFTSIYPVILDLSFGNDLGRHIKEIKENLHQVPNKGIGYGILKYLTSGEHKNEVEFKLVPQVSFNYLGQFDADLSEKSFMIAGESPGNTIDIDTDRENEIEVSGKITDKRLEMSITYSNKQYKKETIEALLNNYHAELTHIIDFCMARDKKEFTPSDMDFKDLTIDELETIFQ